MCGIAGCYPLDRYTKGMLIYLAWEMEERGDDSWGITNGTAVYKSIGPITGSYKVPHTFQFGDAVTLHTRAASVGKVSLENQHPFKCYGTKKNILGVHNGGVGNHAELAKFVNAQPELKEKFTYEVDSHALFMYLACGGDPRKVTGAGALVWWEMNNDSPTKTLNLLRFNTDALHVVKLDNGALVWCSTKGPLEKAARMVGLKIIHSYTISGDTLYQVDPSTAETAELKSGYPLVEVERMVFGGRTFTPPNTTHTNYSRGSYGYNAYDDWHTHNNTPYNNCRPSTSTFTGNVLRSKSATKIIVHDTVNCWDKEKVFKSMIFASQYKTHGLPDSCALCGEPYNRDTAASFTLRTRSDYICGQCVNDVWLETLDGMIAGKIPLILGASASPQTLDTTLPKGEPNDTPNPGEAETIPSVNTPPVNGEGATRDSNSQQEDPADDYEQFRLIEFENCQ